MEENQKEGRGKDPQPLMVKPPQELKDIKESMKKFMEKRHRREKGNDSYKSRIDMHNLFIYNPVVGEMEQRT